MGGSSPSTARPPHPNLRKPVFTTMYDFATLKSPPGTGFTSCPKAEGLVTNKKPSSVYKGSERVVHDYRDWHTLRGCDLVSDERN